MKLLNAMQAVEFYMAQNIPAFMWGAPGIGKTEGAQGLGKKLGLPVIDYRLLLRDPVDLRGLPTVDVNGNTTWARPSDLPFIGNDCPDSGILFIDELNTAPPSMMAAGFGLVQERKVGEHTLKPGWRIIAAGNRQSDRAAANRIPSALANRFAHVDVEADLESWTQWALGVDLAPVVIAFLRFRPELLHKMEGSDLRAFPTPRSWSGVAKVSTAPDALRMNLVAGLVGDGAAAEFEGFMRVWRSLPSIADIIANPDGAPVPTDPATLYAVTCALARKSEKQNFGAVLKYSKRLPREFDILLAVDAVKRSPDLAETAGFVAWAQRNADVTI